MGVVTMEYIEVSGKNVNDAITKACLKLETSSDQLDIKVISEGSSGFLGIGSKPAVIQARKKEIVEEKIETVEEVIAKPEAVKPEKVKVETVKEDNQPVEAAVKTSDKQEKSKTPKSDEEIKLVKEKAEEFLSGVFKAMDLEVAITMEYSEKDDSLNVDFAGPDMGILIGKRGQTLDSLQYLANLVVNKEIQDYVRVKLDTENYRKRRKETLENLARNIAFKVKKTRKAVSLEPMNPYERRIIHSALQGNKFVETCSEGNEPYRHVVVSLKK